MLKVRFNVAVVSDELMMIVQQTQYKKVINLSYIECNKNPILVETI